MRLSLPLLFSLLICSFIQGQGLGEVGYGVHVNNGVRIQNSLPKGGPYEGSTTKHYNYSNLIFFSRVVNETECPLELSVEFSADAIPIPNSPNTYMKLFLPLDTMSMDKRRLFNYGFTEMASFDEPTSFQRVLNSQEDCLFYVAAIFYQTKEDALSEERGGNRAELVLDGEDLYYIMSPQVDSLWCGRVVFGE